MSDSRDPTCDPINSRSNARAYTHIHTPTHIHNTRATLTHAHAYTPRVHAYESTDSEMRKEKYEKNETKNKSLYRSHFFFLQFIVHRTFELERTSAFPAHAQLPKKKFHDNSRVRATKSAKISRRLKIHGATRLRIIESSAARENVVFRRAPESAGWLTRYTILLLKDSPVEGPQEKEKKLNNENEAGFSPTGTCSEVRRAKRINNRDTFLFLRATGYIFGTYFIYLFIFFFFLLSTSLISRRFDSIILNVWLVFFSMFGGLFTLFLVRALITRTTLRVQTWDGGRGKGGGGRDAGINEKSKRWESVGGGGGGWTICDIVRPLLARYWISALIWRGIVSIGKRRPWQSRFSKAYTKMPYNLKRLYVYIIKYV